MSKKNHNFVQIFKTYNYEYRKCNDQQKDDKIKNDSRSNA